MNIFVTGLNYRTAPLAVREALSFNAAEQKEALLFLAGLPQISECVMLSTCNRTELYVYSEAGQPDGTAAAIEKGLCRSKGLPVAEYRKYFYSYRGIGAVQHLFRVTSGLDSMVVGEDQILGQVKQAHRAALEAGTSRTCLNTLFREAVTAAKLIKNEMKSSGARVPRSVASQAVKEALRRMQSAFAHDTFAQDGFPQEARAQGLTGKTVLIIGAGEVGGLVLESLANTGVHKVFLTSRNTNTRLRARTCGAPAGIPDEAQTGRQRVEILDYQRRYDFIDQADLIFSATASPHYTITRDKLEESLITPKPRIFIDLAVPRDIDTDIRELPGVHYLNLDDLAENAGSDWNLSVLEGIRAERIMNEHILSFERWYEFRNVLPLMREIQHASSGYVAAKINDTLAKLQSANSKEKEIVRQAMGNLANHFLNQYLYAVKENVSGEEASVYLKCLGKSMGMGATDENLCGRDRSRRER